MQAGRFHNLRIFGTLHTMIQWPEHPLRALTPTRSDVWKIRILSFLGAVLLIRFFVWFFQSEHVGEAWLYLPIAIAFVFKSLQWVYEWFFYSSMETSPPSEAPLGLRVDVLTTFVEGAESEEMASRTLKSISQIRYPHNSYLCDESDNLYIQNVCQELGITRLSRPIKERFKGKADNINSGLSKTSGEFVAILDADHEPSPYFLDGVLGYFRDPNVGFVQSVQGYYNQGDSLVSRGAAEQTYQFYGPLFLGAHGLETAQTIGANCVFRRAALDSIGGHKDGTTEDRHTAMHLHANGWKSVYVPEILTRGVVPSTISSYYKQQLKWAYGCFKLLFELYPKLFSSFSFSQKVYYGASPLYYLWGIIVFIDITIPVIALLFGFVPITITVTEFLLMYLPVLGIAFFIRQAGQKFLIDPRTEGGVHIVGGFLRTGTWWIYIVGFFDALFRIPVHYITTPKALLLSNEVKISLINVFVAVLLLFAVFFGLFRDSNPYAYLMASFAFLNACVFGFTVIIAQRKFLSRFCAAFSSLARLLLFRRSEAVEDVA